MATSDSATSKLHMRSRVRANQDDQKQLAARLTGLWAQSEHFRLEGVELESIENVSVESMLQNRVGPADGLLDKPPSSYRLVRRLVTEGATVVSASEDDSALPDDDELVLLTRSLSVLEKGETKVYTEILVLTKR